MARTPSQQQLFDELQARYGAEVARAFLAAIDDLTAAADLPRIIAAIQAGNIDAAIAAMNLDDAAYAPLLNALETAYRAGGDATVSTLPVLRDTSGARVIIRFDARNPRAEAILREQSSGLVTRIREEQRDAIRQALEAGLARGDNPRTTALDVVGRIDRATGKRTGGVVGLTQPQEIAARRALEELRSGDPAQMRAYLERKARDRRFDRAVAKAIREEKPLDAATAARAVAQYRNRQLKLRGDLIGQVETFTALAEARHEAYEQAIAAGKVSATAVIKTWRHFTADNPRLQHVAMQGRKVLFNHPFILPDGTQMRYPHDPRAPIKHRAGCRCQADYRIDFLADLR